MNGMLVVTTFLMPPHDPALSRYIGGKPEAPIACAVMYLKFGESNLVGEFHFSSLPWKMMDRAEVESNVLLGISALTVNLGVEHVEVNLDPALIDEVSATFEEARTRFSALPEHRQVTLIRAFYSRRPRSWWERIFG